MGVIGAGGMGSLHAQNLARHVVEARVVAVADVDRNRASSLAAATGATKVFDDPRELIADGDVHAVVITTPGVTHGELVIACAAAGKDVFCEKPLATTLESVRAAGESVSRHHIRLQVGFNRRFDPTYQFARNAIETGKVGTPLVYKGITRDRQAPPRAYLAMSDRNGLLVDTGVHEFDAARWLLRDEVTRVQAFGGVVANHELADVQGPDAVVVNMAFSRGGLANVDLFWGVNYGDDVRAEVIGSKGTLLIGTTARLPVQLMTESGHVQHGYPDHFDRFRDSYLAEIDAFIKSIHADSWVVAGATADDGVKSVEIALAADASMKAGAVAVQLPL